MHDVKYPKFKIVRREQTTWFDCELFKSGVLNLTGTCGESQLSLLLLFFLFKISGQNKFGEEVVVCRWCFDYGWHFYLMSPPFSSQLLPFKFFTHPANRQHFVEICERSCTCRVFIFCVCVYVCEPYETRLAVFDLNWFAVTSGCNMRFQTHASRRSRMVMHGQARTSAHTWAAIVHTAPLHLSRIHICASSHVRNPHHLRF